MNGQTMSPVEQLRAYLVHWICSQFQWLQATIRDYLTLSVGIWTARATAQKSRGAD